MAATVVPSLIVNLKALNQDNYKHWSFRVKTYLLAEDLWDLVEGTNEPPKIEDREYKAWQKNNARALQAITIFCGEDGESSISGIERAKDAWNNLEKKFKPHEILENSDENSEDDLDYDTCSSDGDADSEIEAVQGLAVYEKDGPFFRYVCDKNLEAIKEFIKQHPEAVRAKSKNIGRTALHYAVRGESLDVVKELLPLMKKKDLEIIDDCGHTALSLAILKVDTDAMTEIVKCMVEKNKKLLLCNVNSSTNSIPLLTALHWDRPKMTKYLYSVTPLEKVRTKDRAELISTGLRVRRLDISLDLLQRFPSLGIAKDHSSGSPLNELASTRAGLFSNSSHPKIWERWIYNRIHIPPAPKYTREVCIDVQNEEEDQGNRKQLLRKVTCFFGRLVANLRHLSGINGLYQMKLLDVRTMEILEHMCVVLRREDNLNYMQSKFFQKALFQAVERGHLTFISYMRRHDFRRFLDITNEHGKTVFQFAAELRQDKIFSIIHTFVKERREEIVGKKDKFGNNMLHVVGKLSPSSVHIRGAAFQMQNELQWFKKVERMANLKDINCVNSDGLTPQEVFTVNHRDLVKAGELAMKETATSSSALVAALIITIMFAAAVTVPGGLNGDTGIPIYLHTKVFRIFIVADVISLCSSTTSVMVFLGILTSRFAEEDFLTSLPTKLIIGFFTLFLSIGAMMIAFSSAIFIMLPKTPSIVIPSIVLASVPIASFLWMQLPFLIDIIISTYGFRVFIESRKI